ncbi:MAG: alpha/beta hydrolase [Chloroflexota bacterium]|nr:alpha/beta hydrolase [Chloroflexota bacterium]
MVVTLDDMGSRPEAVPRQHRIRANGITLSVAEYPGPGGGGDDASVVLLHGIGSAGASWSPVIDGLVAHFRLLVADLRGHGASDRPERGYLLPDYAADLDGLLSAFGLDRPLLLGHSLGGLIALTWAAGHPGRGRAIALEDSTLRGGPGVVPSFDGWIALSRLSPAAAAAHYAEEHPDWSAEDCRRRAEAITSVAPGVFTELRAANLDPDQADRIASLAGITSPVLLIHGDLANGGMVVPADAARFATTLPAARIIRVAGAGHSIHRERPDALLAAVIPFLADHAGERRR